MSNCGKIKVLVLSDDCAAHTGFGTVVHNLFGRMADDPMVDVRAIALYPMADDKPRSVNTICSDGPPSDEHGLETLGKLVSNEGWPDIIFLLGDWWYWSKTLLNDKWKKQHRCLSSVWYYAPFDGIQMTTIAAPAYKSADKLLAMSPFGDQILSEYTNRQDIVMLPHGYDATIFPYKKRDASDTITFGVVSRNARRKNLWAIIHAFWALPPEIKARLLLHTAPDDRIAGNLQSWMDFCAQTAEMAGKTLRKVEWTDSVGISRNGNTSTIEGVPTGYMAGIYHQMDVLVSAGREGFGLPYLEGRAAGCRLVLPQYSAHFSMHYPDTITYSCPLTRPEGAAPDVLDIEPDVPNLTNAMVQAWQMHRASGGPPPLPETLSRGLQWSAVSHRLREMIVAHGQSKPRLQFEEAKLFMAIPLEDLQPEKLGPKKRICIVMPRSAGDVLLTTAVAHSLKNHKHRDCELDFVTSSQFFGLLEGCPWIDQIVEFNPDIHGDYHRMGRIYEAYYTPYFRTQVFANWVHGGYGKSLAEVYADDCGVALGEYWCPTKRPEFDIPMEYITFHPGSGTGEQSARWYERWEEVVSEITIPVVQIGTENEPLIEGCVDLRGKTNYAELHHVIQNAKAHLGIDSYPMHIAAILATPIVTIWGNTFPSATGPANALSYWMKCIEPKDRGNCRRPCHYTTCVFGKPCMNNIEPSQIIGEINEVLS